MSGQTTDAPVATLSQDAELETRIWLAYYKAIDSKDPKDWSAFSALAKQRSPQMIARMEKRQGIE